MHLVHKSLQDPKQDPLFKVAVLISCTAVYDPVAWLERGEVRQLDPAIDGQPINIPTAHIWGRQDGIQSECKAVSELSDKSLRFISIHEGGHEVPGLSTKDAVKGAVQAIRRAVTTTMLREETGKVA